MSSQLLKDGIYALVVEVGVADEDIRIRPFIGLHSLYICTHFVLLISHCVAPGDDSGQNYSLRKK